VYCPVACSCWPCCAVRPSPRRPRWRPTRGGRQEEGRVRRRRPEPRLHGPRPPRRLQAAGRPAERHAGVRGDRPLQGLAQARGVRRRGGRRRLQRRRRRAHRHPAQGPAQGPVRQGRRRRLHPLRRRGAEGEGRPGVARPDRRVLRDGLLRQPALARAVQRAHPAPGHQRRPAVPDAGRVVLPHAVPRADGRRPPDPVGRPAGQDPPGQGRPAQRQPRRPGRRRQEPARARHVGQ
jgi:hypothetical protein